MPFHNIIINVLSNDAVFYWIVEMGGARILSDSMCFLKMQWLKIYYLPKKMDDLKILFLCMHGTILLKSPWVAFGMNSFE